MQRTPGWRHLLSESRFQTLAGQYEQKSGCGLALYADGEILIDRSTAYPWREAHKQGIDPDRMTSEALRWGEPSISLDSRGCYVWAVPLCLNSLLVGGLLSATGEKTSGPGLEERAVSRAAWDLLRLTVRHNLTNPSLLELNREKSRVAARKAEAIAALKDNPHQHPREIYLREELELLHAVKRGHKQKAREVINRILVGVYNLGREDLDVLKTLVLEMVVLMFRAAVSRGANPAPLVGINSTFLRDFHAVHDELGLSRWLTVWLEAFISTSFTSAAPAELPGIPLALEYMKNHLGEHLTRDKVAKSCNMSPSHFSRTFHRSTGHTFTDLLSRFRIEQACMLLEESDATVYEIAYRCGFNEQSYFNRVFRRYRRTTPKEYREQQRRARTARAAG
jgi:AraC-like DNA-binding protein